MLMQTRSDVYTESGYGSWGRVFTWLWPDKGWCEGGGWLDAELTLAGNSDWSADPCGQLYIGWAQCFWLSFPPSMM